MCSRLGSELEAALGNCGANWRLRLGTDCAGAEAPVFALREICMSLRDLLEIDVGVDHQFSCDSNYASREFVARNTEPVALFGDLLARGTISHCLLAGAPRLVPSDLDIYIAGFPCKDFSLLNHNRPCLEGPNAAIYEGVVRYIQHHLPRVFVLENVSGILMHSKTKEEAPIREVMRTLRSIPGYQVRGWKVNTLEYWLPQHRKRVYIVGVNVHKVTLRRPLDTWGPFLKKLRGESQVPAHAFMLSDEEPEVRAELEAAQLRQAKWDRRHSKGGSAASLIHSAARRHALQGHGSKWQQMHLSWSQKRGLERAGPWSGMRAGWAPLLGSERTKQVLELSAKQISKRERRDPRSTPFIAEISRGIMYHVSMAGHAPCLTTTCRQWVFSRGRWLIGVEKLALQGFQPDSLDLSCLSESEISMLAGNAMSVPMVGAFLLLVLALVIFPRSGESDGSAADATPRGARPRRRPAKSGDG